MGHKKFRGQGHDNKCNDYFNASVLGNISRY